jgi:anionic cell wall polymer biosynthesis LytR-Cps2A-Psr (LCP) family protein
VPIDPTTTPPIIDQGFRPLDLEDPRDNKKLIFIVSLVFVALLLLPTLIFAFISNRNRSLSGPPLENPLPTPDITLSTTPEPGITINPTPLPTNTNYMSVLLLGKGGGTHSGGHLTDSITQLVFYPTKLKAALIAIPRDTYVEAGSPKRWMKINHSFPESPQNTKLAVEKITGIRVDHYVLIDFDHFVALIDYLGGITVNVPTTFTDYFFPIKGQEDNTCGKSVEELAELHKKYSGFQLEKQFTCRYETLAFTKGPVQMNGSTTLKFVRSRHSDTGGSDFARLDRTSAVLVAISQNLTAKLTQNTIVKIYEQLSKFASTDIGQANITAWNLSAETFQKTTATAIPLKSELFVNGTSPIGEFILEPTAGRGGWGPIHQYINSQMPN